MWQNDGRFGAAVPPFLHTDFEYHHATNTMEHVLLALFCPKADEAINESMDTLRL